eukprot:5372674-Lingulodinium_polyedra.AAC.1
MLEASMGPVVQRWLSRGSGFRLPGGSSGAPGSPSAITHLVWADNWWLFASSKADLQSMAQEVAH